MAEIQSIAAATRTVVESLHLDSQFRKINDWLSPPDPSTNFVKAQKMHYEGTGLWFLESELFQQWKSGSRQHLWLYGIPGCGKTVLSSTIINHLRQNQEGSSTLVLDFFFDFSDTRKQSVDQLVRSLVAQLYSRCQDSRRELDALFTNHKEGNQQPTTDSLCATLKTMMQHVKTIQIVIDALDECQTRKDLLSWMRELATSEHRNIYLLATSRREDELESELKSWLSEENFIPIQQGPVDADIGAYIHGTLRAHNEFQRWRSKPAVLDEIKTELMKKAGRM